MSGSTNPTDGMFYSKDGSYTGQVSVSASKVDLEAGDYTNYDSSTDQLKQKAVNLGELSEAGATDLLTATNISNQLKALEVEATLKSAEIIQNSNITLAKAITNSALGIKASMNEASLQTDGMMTMQGEIYLQLEALVKATKEQKLELSTSSLSMGNLNVQVEPIVNAINNGVQNQITTNSKIVEGIESQTATNLKIVENLEKKNDHLDYLKNGDSDLKDSRGNVIKPREVEAKKNAEQHIDQKEINETDYDEIGDFFEAGLGMLGDFASDVIGSSDGFGLEFNPLDKFDRFLVDDYMKEIDNLTK